MTYLSKFNAIIVAMLLTAFSAFGKQEEKSKTIEKEFAVNDQTRLEIRNKFGTVKINSWDKKQFQVKVEITARGKNEDRAQRILDDIKIDIQSSAAEVFLSTDMPNMKSKNDEGFEVNYVVYMPEKNPLAIENSFGDVTMGDRGNKLKLEVSYGSFKVGDVSGDTEIKLSFGGGSISEINKGEVTVKYSKLEIESAQMLDLIQGFSNIEIKEVAELELESKYGKVEIETAGKIDAEAQFSGLQIEELTGSLELDASYISNFRIDKVAKSFTSIDIDGQFGSYTIGLEDGLQANIDAEFSFADLKIDSDLNVDFHYQEKESNRKTYRGKIGGGHESKEIRIDSSYGNLRLTIE